MMCGIDEAIRHIQNDYSEYVWTEMVINRLDYHRRQADGVKPTHNKGTDIKDWYTCSNCGVRVEITWNFCPGCGYRIKWNSIRCLTGLPLADAAEKQKERKE